MRTLWIVVGAIAAVLVGTVGGFVLYPIDQNLFAGFSLIALSASVAFASWISIAALVRASASKSSSEDQDAQQGQPQRPRTQVIEQPSES